VITLSTAFNYLQFNFSSTNTTEKCFKITSYNSMLFDLYNWFHNTDTRNKIFTNLSEIDSDIMCFQEFYTSEEPGDFNNIDSLTKLLNLPYHHAEYTTTLREHDHWGVATFSRFPIIHKGKIVFETKTNNLCIYTDVIIKKDTVRIYNLHLQSISFSKKDNSYLEDLKKGNETDEDLEKGKNILRRLKRAFVKRAKQVEIIKLHMKTCKYKMILCGDFNDTPASYTYAQLNSDLKDAFVAKGKGLGKTYAGKWPQFRIDYILYDKRFKCEQFERSDETFTDHYPITALIH
ncbi:MAG: endonuclease/exonuclease/phosphatase family protein, partial [Sphingobacteriaceae bacterium]